MTGVLGMEMNYAVARLRTGFDWWLNELGAMAAPLTKQIGRKGGSLAAVADATGYTLYRDGQPAGRADPARPTEAALTLPETVALVRETPAPGLSERDWRRILMDEIDRLTPFPPADVYVALTFAGEGATRTARMAAAPRRNLEAEVANACAAGVAPVALLAFAPDGAAVDLLPAFRVAERKSSARSNQTWWGVVGLMLVLNIGAAILRDVSETQRLEAAVADAQPAADRLRRLREGVQANVAARHDLLIRRAQTDPLQLLDRLTRALPQAAYVDRLELDGRSLRLAGRHAIDVDVAAALRSAGFSQVRSASPDLAQATPDAAHAVPFDITARLPPRPGETP